MLGNKEGFQVGGEGHQGMRGPAWGAPPSEQAHGL